MLVQRVFQPNRRFVIHHEMRYDIVCILSWGYGLVGYSKPGKPAFGQNLKLDFGSPGWVVLGWVAHISHFVRSRGLKKTQVAHR